MVLRVEVFDDTVSLSLQQIDNQRCALTMVADRKGRPAGWVRKAKNALMMRLTQRPPALPGSARAAQRAARPAPKSADVLGGADDWKVDVGPAEVVVRFESDPPGATVAVDGIPLPKPTPCSKSLPSGRRVVAMTRERHVVRKETVAVKDGARVRWTLAPDFGTVAVTSQPPGLTVTVDGKPQGKTPLQRLEVSHGPHDILVSGPCHSWAAMNQAIRQTFSAATCSAA